MSDRPVLVLLNPPGTRIYIRDNFCSKVSQAAYINHPIDLVMLSGRLDPFYTLHLIDAIVDCLPVEETLARLVRLRPEVVVSLTGSASWKEDRRFFRLLRERLPDCLLVAAGDVLLENTRQTLEQEPAIDAVVLNYTTDDLPRMLQTPGPVYAGLIYRHEGLIVGQAMAPEQGEHYALPLPRHDLFIGKDYRYPFVSGKPFATIQTEYGCPWHCRFCVMGTLGSRYRTIDNVVEELHAVRRLGIRDLFLLDQTFASRRTRAEELLSHMMNFSPRFRWVCFSRVDVVDRVLLQAMKQAGCHTVMFGVESADEALLKKYHKDYDRNQIEQAFTAARSVGLRTVGTFLFGLPGDTRESCLATIEFARSLQADYFSLNVAVPRMATDLRREAVEKGLVDDAFRTMDQSGTEVAMATPQLSREQVSALRRFAIRRLYLRPSYLFRRLSQLKSMHELRIQAREAFSLLRNFLSS